MISQPLRITTLAKGAIAMSLVFGAFGGSAAAAGTQLAGPADPAHLPSVGAERRSEPSKECLEAYARWRELKKDDATADEREAAMRAVREACERTKPLPKPEAKPEPAADVERLVKECVAAYARALERAAKGNPGEDAEVAGRKA